MDKNVRKKLQELFLVYTKNLPDKIQAIEQQWNGLLVTHSPESFQKFHRDVHSLCGSAGTYGYIDLGKAARQLEVLLKSLLSVSSLTSEHKEKITAGVEQLKLIFSLSAPEKSPAFASDDMELLQGTEKFVYLLEEDDTLVSGLTESLRQAGFTTKVFKELSKFKTAIEERAPMAVIVDTDFLDDSMGEDPVGVQVSDGMPIQVFCIVPDAELMPRLKAIRAGGQGFFQKPVDVFELTQILNQKCSVAGEPYRILIIDDSEYLNQYHSLILTQAGMVTHTISNPLHLLTALEDFQPDLLLMDIYMPGCTGLELAAVLRQESRYTKIPIIFLSTEDDKRKQLSAISLGGDDFLTKPVSPQHLISAVRSRAKRASILNYYMTTDSLTGLLNHSSFLKQLENEIFQARQKHIPLTFIMIDIDFFKKINDTYGHPLGDVVIKKLATLLLVRLRGQDIIGRYGGEEFAIILPGATSEKSQEICDELRKEFSRDPFTTHKVSFSATFSAGISSLRHDDGSQAIIEEADHALYEAKARGRNQVVVFKP